MNKNIKEEDQVIAMKEEDVLAKLMEKDEVPTTIIQVPRIGNIEIHLKGLKDAQINSIREECTKKKKVNGKWTREVNNTEFDAGLIVAATTNFDWNNPKLLESKQASDGKAYIMKKLLPGERSFLATKVLELSGFNDELEEKEDIKN